MSKDKNGIMRTSVDAMQVGDFIRVLPGIPDSYSVFDIPFFETSRLPGDDIVDAPEVRRFERVTIEAPNGERARAWERIR